MPLLERHARGVWLTKAGEILQAHAKSALQENAATLERIRALANKPGMLRLGAPHNVLQPHVPHALRLLHEIEPDMEVQVLTNVSRTLKEWLAAGEIDLILTTEFLPPPGARLVATRQIVFGAAPGSDIWMRRPLPLAMVRGCMFTPVVKTALDRAGIEWVDAVEGDTVRTVEVAVAAEKAVQAVLETALPPFLAPVRHGGALPDLPPVGIYLSIREAVAGQSEPLAKCLAASFSGLSNRLPSEPISSLQ
jgi:DNA-binding transcriptional LysR family regulator